MGREHVVTVEGPDDGGSEQLDVRYSSGTGRVLATSWMTEMIFGGCCCAVVVPLLHPPCLA